LLLQQLGVIRIERVVRRSGQRGKGQKNPFRHEVRFRWGRAIIAAFARPENQGRGVISLEGRMVERMHADIAARTVLLDEAIRARAA
jgi:hypothetical protein